MTEKGKCAHCLEYREIGHIGVTFQNDGTKWAYYLCNACSIALSNKEQAEAMGDTIEKNYDNKLFTPLVVKFR